MGYIPPIVIGTTATADISDRVVSMSVSLTLNEASQITLTVQDNDLAMLRANYFQIRQTVQYLGRSWEIASMEVRQARSKQQVTLELRPAAIQAMKRNKGRNLFKGGSATAYAAEKAREVGLAFFGENAAPKSNIAQGSNNQTDESVWDVLKRIAGENSFICFESDGRLFFCSEPFLLGKFGVVGYGETPGFVSVPIIWDHEPRANKLIQQATPIVGPPERPTLQLGSQGRSVRYLQEVLVKRAGQTITDEAGYFGPSTLAAVQAIQAFFQLGESATVQNMTWNIVDFLGSGLAYTGPEQGFYYITPLGVPNCRKSDNAQDAGTATFTVEREQGKLLRPGMTVRIDGVPYFENHYLVNDVNWNEGTNDPVSVSTRTLVEPLPSGDGKNEELNRFRAALSWTGGGYAKTVLDAPFWSTTG
jgi:peptidoglycan hydrolase-like protein with peptidoglycan-binding domain